ncbi:hypothetical protein B5M09_001985 [Aphanomyces astaci]|uniref:Uncharacterized protein n=1 Tax=Aphanomyces astaci TaxID=112090 RepID=A0A3R7YIU6_APHAT|nr:hypothetical protein B5M09_001985 [Aphanomyces astaci]
MMLLHREMDINHTKLVRENDLLVYELSQAKYVHTTGTVSVETTNDSTRITIKPLKDELVKTKDELNTAQLSALRSAADATELQTRHDTLKQRYIILESENESLEAQLIDVCLVYTKLLRVALMSLFEQLRGNSHENDLRIDQLVEALANTTQNYDQVQSQFDFLSDKHAETSQLLQALLVESIANGNPSPLNPNSSHRRQSSEFSVSNPTSPLYARSDSYHQSTTLPSSFLRQLHQSMDGQDGGNPTGFDCTTMLHQESAQEKRRAEVLKRGSLFHELSRELEKEFMKAKQAPLPLPPPPSSCSNCTVLMEREAALAQQEIHRLNALVASKPEPLPEENLLKEFFVLTAAAIKIAGAGIQNDRCNIANEVMLCAFARNKYQIKPDDLGLQVLFDQAMAEDMTFDKFHDWIFARLESPP